MVEEEPILDAAGEEVQMDINKPLRGRYWPTDLPTYPELVERNRELRAALHRAYDHLRFNKWENDPGSDRRFEAVQDLEKVLR